MTLASHELQVDRRRLEVDHGRGNDAGDMMGRERGQEGFIRKQNTLVLFSLEE